MKYKVGQYYRCKKAESKIALYSTSGYHYFKICKIHHAAKYLEVLFFLDGTAVGLDLYFSDEFELLDIDDVQFNLMRDSLI